MSRRSSIVRISESMELPIFTGTIEIDTSQGGITILMKPGPIHRSGETLTLTKVSHDTGIIALFSDTTLINHADIILFGVPSFAKVNKAKVRTLVLKSDGKNWLIIHEE
jgi:hypothetical protein